jgi:hypothetical protein
MKKGLPKSQKQEEQVTMHFSLQKVIAGVKAFLPASFYHFDHTFF